MNLRNFRNGDNEYNIGLDIGTGSVGWSATEAETNELCYFKGKPTWGSRTFPNADTAAATRLARGQRRRYIRRRNRLNLLQWMFASEINKVDPEFFIRLNQSYLNKNDRDFGHPLFNGSDFTESGYYESFPTIYHLRHFLVNSKAKQDIRLVYLALHNIVKARGNFLYQENKSLCAKNADMDDALTKFKTALFNYLEEIEGEYYQQPVFHRAELKELLETAQESKSAIAEKIADLLGFKDKALKPMAKNIGKAIVGHKADFSKVFDIDFEDSNFYLSDDEKVEAFQVNLDKELDLFEAIKGMYSSYMLLGILEGAEGQTISASKIKEYERYGEDLQTLKKLFREYLPDKYDEFFRGEFYADGSGYNKQKAKGYTKYDLDRSQAAREAFFKDIKKVFAGTPGEEDTRYIEILDAINDDRFLKRLKTSGNGVIPYQLHLEEMEAIIDNQSVHYPFLKENRDKLLSLVEFRIPYYVGPLTTVNAATDEHGDRRFAWSVRLPGKENERVYPWNFDDVIDKDASAEAFMNRMIGTCTYLLGEQVMPRCSLDYDMFCVLNELNGARYSIGAEIPRRFDYGQRRMIIEELFKKHKTVSYKAVADLIQREHKFMGDVRVFGGQGEAGFESKLNSLHDFKKILGLEDVVGRDYAMVEEIIKWNTLFEDRDILKRKIKQSYGDRLNGAQIKAICKKRYTGWGRLSQKLLTGLKTPTDNGPKSIMDILEEGDPNNRRIGKAMNLMEILHDDQFEFEMQIDAHNKAYIGDSQTFSLEDLPGSPALRRAVNQAQRIVEEIVAIAGKPPANIFIEVTRDDDPRTKGKRTKRRYDAIKQALQAFKKEDPELWSELETAQAGDLANEKLALYFMQRGKSMYSGKRIEIGQLQKYHVDHIIPQSYTKDDSLDNKVLVLQEENERKLDNLLLDPALQKKMKPFWSSLHDADLISDKKFNNLMRDRITDRQMEGFISRQLVETSQIVKHVGELLSTQYPTTKIVPVKAWLTHALRERCDFVKCREINDYHHAHDAYLACRMGSFIQQRHGKYLEEPVRMAKAMRLFVQNQASEYSRSRKTPGSGGYFVSSFMSDLQPLIDVETGEILQDGWDHQAEIAKIHRCLNFKDCFISRMPEESTGAFWDATIYSPRDEKKSKGGLNLPIKRDRDPRVYGSYSREQFAYFFLYKARNKKGNIIAQFSPVPVSVVSLVENDISYLEEFARKDASEKELIFEGILRNKIYKYQLIEREGNRFYITGKQEVRNAVPLAFDMRDADLISRIVQGKEVTKEDLDSLVIKIVEKIKKHAAHLGAALKIDELPVKLSGIKEEDKRQLVLSLISITAGKTNMINTIAYGGSKYAGQMHPNMAAFLHDAIIVDQSVTGMFEHRIKIDLDE